MVIELTAELESALKMRANENGVSADAYVREVLERDIGSAGKPSILPFKSTYGILAKYGPAPTAEEIDENRKDMLRNFGEGF